MRVELIRQLEAASEEKLRAFNQRIVSDTRYPILGVRTPAVRALAKKLAKNWRELLMEAQFQSYEETLAVGLAIAYAKDPLPDKLDGLRTLLPKLDSWGMTDTIAPTLKPKEKDLGLVWEFAGECLTSEREYTVRFGIILMLDDFLTPEFLPKVQERILGIRDERYYVNMARAWLLAEMGTKDFGRVYRLLESGSLDLFTHNMTIRKMRESYRITKEQKEAVLPLKRKEEK